jgi:rubrerythrin
MIELERILDRCRAFEDWAAAVYRTYAASSRDVPELCALWTAMAREEEDHSRSLLAAKRRLAPREGWRTQLEGWNEALHEIETRLRAAEQQHGATADQQLAAALDLEMSELDTLRQTLLAVSHTDPPRSGQDEHLERLAEAAERHSTDPHVRLQAALLRARARVRDAGGSGALR